MIHEFVKIIVKDGIAIITIDRQPKLNALNNQILDELSDVFAEIKNDDAIGVVILTGAGDKAFVAGADISEISVLDTMTAKKFSEKGQNIFNMIEDFPKPVIAAVNGFALGGGCELSLACHIRLVADSASFGQPEVKLGIMPGYGGTQRLARLINPGRAAEYILTGDLISAKEAYRVGLANKIVEQTKLMSEAIKLANKIKANAQLAVTLSLRAITKAHELTNEQGMNLEASLFALSCGTDDAKEGIAAFLEKRKPIFKNK